MVRASCPHTRVCVCVCVCVCVLGGGRERERVMEKTMPREQHRDKTPPELRCLSGVSSDFS